MQARQKRRIFFVAFAHQLQVVWPIFSIILGFMTASGLLIGWLENWRIDESLYFTFVTGLTIGYGDLTPARITSRFIALGIGLAGIILTGLVAAISVQALKATDDDVKP